MAQEIKLNEFLDTTYGVETKDFRGIEGNYVLSPSSISKFYDNAANWWLDRNGKTTFDGNTNTVLGNAVHGAIDAYWANQEEYNRKKLLIQEDFILNPEVIPTALKEMEKHHQIIEVTEADVKLWIEKRYEKQMNTEVIKTVRGKEITFPKVDIDVVLKHFMPMFNQWVIEYGQLYPMPSLREYHIKIPMQDNIIVAGSLDGYEEERKVLIDYKTCGQKPQGLSKAHELQAMSYVIGLRQEGIIVETIRIVYIQRPTKTLPARIWIHEKEVTDEMLLQTVIISENMKKSINIVTKYPELEDIVFRENILSQWD